jgi:hypothetical protein
MSQEIDRIPVPTNGKGPHPGEAIPLADDEPDTEPVTSVVFTPTQLAVGFGIIASLVLFGISRLRRRNRSRSRGPFGGR